MVIERIYGSNQVQKAHNAKKSREAKQKDAGVKNDKISISSAAQEKAVFSKALEAAKAAPDMRAERVKAAKENIEKERITRIL